MSHGPAPQEKMRLVVTPALSVHEIAGHVRTSITGAYGQTVFESSLVLFEQKIGGRLERAKDVLHHSSPGSVKFHYALCWLDASELSPVLQFCWSQTSFRTREGTA